MKYIIALILACFVSVANGETLKTQNFERSGITFTISTDIDTSGAQSCISQCVSNCLATEDTGKITKDEARKEMKDEFARALKKANCSSLPTEFKRSRCITKVQDKFYAK